MLCSPYTLEGWKGHRCERRRSPLEGMREVSEGRRCGRHGEGPVGEGAHACTRTGSRHDAWWRHSGTERGVWLWRWRVVWWWCLAWFAVTTFASSPVLKPDLHLQREKKASNICLLWNLTVAHKNYVIRLSTLYFELLKHFPKFLGGVWPTWLCKC